jgi:DNA-binding MarR family transcriptional regulator
MRIEDEIKQQHFKSEYQKAFLNVKVTASWLSGLVSTTLKPYGLSQEQYNVLRILRGQHPKPSTLGLISERMVDKMSNATRLVEKLRKSGLATREVCPTNRRKVDILITDKGLELLKSLDPIVNGLTKESMYLSEEELRTLNALLDKMRG